MALAQPEDSSDNSVDGNFKNSSDIKLEDSAEEDSVTLSFMNADTAKPETGTPETGKQETGKPETVNPEVDHKEKDKENSGEGNHVENIADPIEDSENITDPIKDSENMTGPVKDSENITDPIKDSEDITDPIKDLENITDPIKDSENITDPIKDSENITDPIEESENITDPEPGLQKKRKIDEVEEESERFDPDSTPLKKPHTDNDVKRLLPDLEKFWLTVEQDPTDFSAWTHLLQYVDQVTHMSVASEAYDSFLTKYPYCYGYWKKFADYAKRRGSALEVQQVFTRGLQAIPLSVDLWIHFLSYIKSIQDEDENFIRSKFELGVEACGLEFRSDKLWEQFVQWEVETKNLKNAMRVWDQILKTPTQGLKKQFEKFVEFVGEHEPSEILSEVEYSALSTEVGDESAPAGEQEDLVTKIRSKIIQLRSDVYQQTLNEIKMRSSYEDGIKRPYFHVKPVEKNQLKNWMEYLNFEIEKGELKRIVTLFERCLIACAMYAEYWEKYLKFLQAQCHLDVPKIQEVFTRVTTIHHPKIYKFHLDFAAFEEIQGNLEKSSTIYEELLSSAASPILPVYHRHIHFERRRQNMTICCDLFEKYIKNCGEDNALSIHLTIKYARFLNHFLGAYTKAVETLKSLLDTDLNPKSKVLMALIELGMHATPLDYESVIYALEYGIKNLNKQEKLTFAQRKLEFLEEYGKDIKSVQIAHEDLNSISKTAKEEPKPDGVVNSVKISNSEAKITPSTENEAIGYDYNSSNPAYSSQYGQYAQGQYSSSWNSQAPVAPADPSVYGQSYVNQPTSWNSFYA